MSAGDSSKQLHIIFAGRVQGVGFRLTACRVAERFAVTGYVRNCTNGNVELIAEGPEGDLVGFLNGIRDSMVGRYISRETISWKPPTGHYTSFGISY